MKLISIGLLVFGWAVAHGAQKDDVQGVANQLSESIDTQPKPRLLTVGNVIVIVGEFEKYTDLDKINGIAESLRELTVPSGTVIVRNQTRLSDKGKSDLAEKIVARIGAREITASFVNDSLLLEGSAENDFQADRAVEIAKTFFRGAPGRKPAGENAEPSPYNAHSGKGTFEIIDMLRVKPSPKGSLPPRGRKP
jgi:hypothetical protein